MKKGHFIPLLSHDTSAAVHEEVTSSKLYKLRDPLVADQPGSEFVFLHAWHSLAVHHVPGCGVDIACVLFLHFLEIFV